MAAVAITAGLVAEATGGRLTAGAADVRFNAVSSDSRAIAAGALFVALKGDRFDGHSYVEEAQRRGAAGLLVSRSVPTFSGVAVVEVPDTLAALQALARDIRQRSRATVIAITGSAGKTSTKELTADVLAARYDVFRNQGNLNNHIGLPLSLTELARGPEMAVVELGMNHAGEIRQLIRIARPDVRVWTNVGDAHLGHFGSRDALADAKAEVLELADQRTLAVANADDALVMVRLRGFPGRVLTFGTDASADIRATDVVDRGFEGVTATVRTGAGDLRLATKLPGRAHLMNVLAAVAVALDFKIEPSDIIARVAAARPVPRRGTLIELSRGLRLVDDSYNASPAAMRMMLQALSVTPATGRRIAVLGEMLELGHHTRALHESCGRAAWEAGVDLLVAVGGAAADGFVTGAVSAGLAPDRALRFPDSATAAAPVAGLVQPGDAVLVKGSRGTRTDLIADALVAAQRQA